MRAYAQFLIGATLSVIFIPLVAAAQTRGRDPLDTQTAAPSAPYPSAFSDYKSYQDPELMPWRVANDTVREFGGMAGMKDMGDMKASDRVDDKSGDRAPSNQPAKPSHDMGNMKGEMPGTAPKSPASSGDKPAAMENMPNHDMSKMKAPDKASKSKAMPRHDMKGKQDMADMPGHDMGGMAPSTSKPQPVPPAPKSMPDHGSMSH